MWVFLGKSPLVAAISLPVIVWVWLAVRATLIFPLCTKEPVPMTDTADTAQAVAPVGSVKVMYLGPVAPHWEVRGEYGDRGMIDAFRSRVNARLMLLPPHDPQFRRNRERVNRDAERDNFTIVWDLGYDEG
jgi:hypothetical protein